MLFRRALRQCGLQETWLVDLTFIAILQTYFFIAFKLGTWIVCCNACRNNWCSAYISSSSHKINFICAIATSEQHIGSKQKETQLQRKKPPFPRGWWLNYIPIQAATQKYKRQWQPLLHVRPTCVALTQNYKLKFTPVTGSVQHKLLQHSFFSQSQLCSPSP